MIKLARFILVLFVLQTASAATLHLCATYDDYNKFFVGDTSSAISSLRGRVVRLCESHHENRGACVQHSTCQAFPNKVATHIQKIIPFPKALQGHPWDHPTHYHPGAPSSPSQPDPTPTPRETNAHGDCHSNSDCFSQEYCASGQCFEKSGNEGGSCKSNSDCFSNEFCVSGACYPQSGHEGGSCKSNSDCFSTEFCVSGSCFEK